MLLQVSIQVMVVKLLLIIFISGILNMYGAAISTSNYLIAGQRVMYIDNHTPVVRPG
jgi:hypothetical protein